MKLPSVPTFLRPLAGGWLAALLLCGCTPSPELIEQRLYAMGTWVDIGVVAPPAAARAALREAETLLRSFEIDYYAWGDGELARVNRALGTHGEAALGPEMEALLIEARAMTVASGGAFDPGVGALVELWGFHTADAEPRRPAVAEIERWLAARASLADAEIGGGQIRSVELELELDLGGIAKGEAVDRILALLASRGIGDAIVNAGGDLRVLGRRKGRPWRIGIQDPRADTVLGVIELEDGDAAFTSGDYERFIDDADGRAHHILDPRTGRPAADTRAITVIARRGVHADAAATALLVAGDQWPATAEALGIDAVLRVDAEGEVEISETMRRRLVAGHTERWDVIAES